MSSVPSHRVSALVFAALWWGTLAFNAAMVGTDPEWWVQAAIGLVVVAVVIGRWRRE